MYVRLLYTVYALYCVHSYRYVRMFTWVYMCICVYVYCVYTCSHVYTQISSTCWLLGTKQVRCTFWRCPGPWGSHPVVRWVVYSVACNCVFLLLSHATHWSCILWFSLCPVRPPRLVWCHIPPYDVQGWCFPNYIRNPTLVLWFQAFYCSLLIFWFISPLKS